MLLKVMDEEMQDLKLKHAEEVNACLEASPIELLTSEKNRKVSLSTLLSLP